MQHATSDAGRVIFESRAWASPAFESFQSNAGRMLLPDPLNRLQHFLRQFGILLDPLAPWSSGSLADCGS